MTAALGRCWVVVQRAGSGSWPARVFQSTPTCASTVNRSQHQLELELEQALCARPSPPLPVPSAPPSHTNTHTHTHSHIHPHPQPTFSLPPDFPRACAATRCPHVHAPKPAGGRRLPPAWSPAFAAPRTVRRAPADPSNAPLLRGVAGCASLVRGRVEQPGGAGPHRNPNACKRRDLRRDSPARELASPAHPVESPPVKVRLGAGSVGKGLRRRLPEAGAGARGLCRTCTARRCPRPPRLSRVPLCSFPRRLPSLRRARPVVHSVPLLKVERAPLFVPCTGGVGVPGAPGAPRCPLPARLVSRSPCPLPGSGIVHPAVVSPEPSRLRVKVPPSCRVPEELVRFHSFLEPGFCCGLRR